MSAMTAMDTLRALWADDADTPGLQARGVSLPQLRVQREALARALAAVDAIKPCCHSCDRFDLGSCQHHGAPVPSDFQEAIGKCPDWAYDGIPF